MNFLIGLAAKLLEKLALFFADLLARYVVEKRKADEEKAKVEENLKDLKDAKTPEEKRRRRENLLNND